jgi:hypothetical protein
MYHSSTPATQPHGLHLPPPRRHLLEGELWHAERPPDAEVEEGRTRVVLSLRLTPLWFVSRKSMSR